MDSIRLKARAKINLGLDVLGKRDNGYHDVRMVMQTVGIYDRLIINKIPEDDIRIDINLKFLPVNENNLTDINLFTARVTTDNSLIRINVIQLI